MNIEEMKKERLPIVEKCKIFKKEVIVKKVPTMMEKGPCKRTEEDLCAAYINPALKWKLGDCPLATHIIVQEEVEKFVNPLKASRRRARK